jgi:hypothetical protein
LPLRGWECCRSLRRGSSGVDGLKGAGVRELQLIALEAGARGALSLGKPLDGLRGSLNTLCRDAECSLADVPRTSQEVVQASDAPLREVEGRQELGLHLRRESLKLPSGCGQWLIDPLGDANGPLNLLNLAAVDKVQPAAGEQRPLDSLKRREDAVQAGLRSP